MTGWREISRKAVVKIVSPDFMRVSVVCENLCAIAIKHWKN